MGLIDMGQTGIYEVYRDLNEYADYVNEQFDAEL